MQLSAIAGALSVLGLFVHDARADASSAQLAMSSFLSKSPITTRSAAQSQSTPNLANLKAAALAGNLSSTQSWDFVRERCPGNCSILGLNSDTWPSYSHYDRLALCDQPVLLDFALYTPVNKSSGHVSIRGCAADLEVYNTWAASASSCPAANNTVNVTSSLQLIWDTAGGNGNTINAVNALQQVYAYELVSSAHCNETINFALSGDIVVGLYMGSGLHGQSLLAPILKNLIQYVLNNGVPETLVAQLCDSKSHVYTTGIYISKSGGLTGAQNAVRTWRNGSCLTSLGESQAWNNINYSMAIHAHQNSSSTTLQRRRSREFHIHGLDHHTHGERSHLHARAVESDSDGNCYSYLVVKGDTCDSLATSYDVTVAEIENYNSDTWGWMGCDDVLAGEYICLSSGWPPMPTIISNAVCGPQVNGTATAPHGTDLTTLNPCPLNACCDIWGQCGTTAEFCTPTNSTTGSPGTAANGTNGCISNCGTDLIQSDAPSETFNIGYFEGFDLSRPCMRTWLSNMDLSSYTHIHMSFATFNSDFSFNISSIEEQMNEFVSLTGVKRIITVGGWDFSTDPSSYDLFREAVGSSANRASLVSNTIAFLNKYDLDGVDWDWEYPGEPDIPGIPADTTDSATDLFLFLLELNIAMTAQTPDKTISTTVPSSYWYMKAIPIEAISAVVDYIVIMTYDMHGQWDWNSTYADPGCPAGSCLRSHVNLTETINSLSMITKAGVPSNKVVVGVSSYARSFQMTEAGCWDETCTFVGPDSGAVPGSCTNTAGYISNAELAAIMEDEDVYTYIDATSNSNIMVWNGTQWAAWMDDDIKAVRKQLYADMNFLGSADWAIDLQTSNDTSGSNSSSESTSCEISLDPSIWSDDSPTVTAESGCTIIWPPMPLSTNTTISFPEWRTQVTWWSTSTKTVTFENNLTAVYHGHSGIVVPTGLSIDPVTIDAIPVWDQVPSSGQTVLYQTSSVLPSPFPVVMTPTVGGTTSVVGGTTTTMSSFSFASGNITYATASWIYVYGGTTSVENGTVLAPTTTTVTPHPYPTTTDSTPDSTINTRTTHRSSTTSSSGGSTSSGGGSTSSTCVPSLLKTCGTGCAPFCIRGCSLCPPDYDGTSGGGSGGSGRGSGSGAGDDDNSSTSTSTSTETGSYVTLPGVASAVADDSVETATDALTALEALASAESGIMASIWGDGPTSSSTTATATGTATTKATGTIGTATATATSSSSTLGCYVYQDPDSGSTGSTSCECPGYDGTLPELTGSVSPCGYTSLPTTTSKYATTTSATVPYPYTFTDLYGVVVACESESSLQIAGYLITECAGSSTTEKEVTITVTEVVTTSALNKLCTGGGYFACVADTEDFGLASCPKNPWAQKKCEDPVFENAQSLCSSRCTQTSSTYTTTYATLAP